MWSFASTPGNCFVMPRSSRTGVSSIRGDSMLRFHENGPHAGPVHARSSSFRLGVLRGLDLAGNDLPPQHRDLGEHLPLQLALQPRADLAEGDAVVLEV